MKNSKYLFISNRLGFRNWNSEDESKMIAISADERVMEFFPATASAEQTIDFIGRMKGQFEKYGYCYFAVEEIDSGKFIGFIGLMFQDYMDVSFLPATDIGWRLHPDFWGKGYATEGAKRVLEFAFETLKLDKVVSTAPAINKASINVMQKIGMEYLTDFIHPRLKDNERLRDCVCYVLKRVSF